MTIARLMYNRKEYVIIFDEYDTLDTVQCGDKFLSTKNKVVKKIMAHSESIRRGNIPEGFQKVKR